ncbi:MAG: nucleoside monophosphate kinase [Patescibacteria group bacterium]|nr:nucleoside monophosphate kinase [Patescibacteria group bacterium]
MKEINIKPRAETIIFLGPPGSGKDTQAEFLVEKLGFQLISSGKLIRLRAEHDDELHDILKKGDLVPNNIIDDEIISIFALLPDEQPVILDGYPRTLEQAKKLDLILSENNRKLDKVIYINVPDKDLINRIKKRRVCSSCQKFTMDKFEACPYCGGKLTQRNDDTPETLKNRLKVFHQNTKPVIEYFKERRVLLEVDGSPSIDRVKESIRRLF